MHWQNSTEQTNQLKVHAPVTTHNEGITFRSRGIKQKFPRSATEQHLNQMRIMPLACTTSAVHDYHKCPATQNPIKLTQVAVQRKSQHGSVASTVPAQHMCSITNHNQRKQGRPYLHQSCDSHVRQHAHIKTKQCTTARIKTWRKCCSSPPSGLVSHAKVRPPLHVL